MLSWKGCIPNKGGDRR